MKLITPPQPVSLGNSAFANLINSDARPAERVAESFSAGASTAKTLNGIK